jgi:hypothetical protein
MSTGIIKAYRHLEQLLSTPERKVTLVGKAGYPRPCPQCGKRIPEKGEVINIGKLQDKWTWVCPSCAPSDPSETPHVLSLHCPECGCFLANNEHMCSGCRKMPPGASCWDECSYCGGILNCEGCSPTNCQVPRPGVSCRDASCCGFCGTEECETRDACERCEEWRGWPEGTSVCCGECGDCPHYGGGIGEDDLCDYCQQEVFRGLACSSDDRYMMRKIGQEIDELEKRLAKAKDAYKSYEQCWGSH